MDRTRYLGYTPAAESRRLIAHGMPEVLPGTLGGRHRFTPLSLHVSERIAAAAFARLDDVGSFWVDVWMLARLRGGRWQLRGGGTAAPTPPGDDALAPRPVAAVLNGLARAGETTRCDARSRPWILWPRRWMACCLVRLSAEVGSVRVAGQEIRVPEHGRQALIWWPSSRGTDAELLDHKGERISTIVLG